MDSLKGDLSVADKTNFDYGEDTQQTAPSDAAFQKIHDLVSQAIIAEREMIEADELAKTKRENHRRVIEELLPTAMDELGLEKFRTRDGLDIKIKKDLTCSLAADRKEAGFRWLEEKGHGSVIKREVVVSFAKGMENEATAVVQELTTAHPTLPVSSERSVHPSTLKSLIKTLLEEGEAVPEEIFKQRMLRKAVVG